jgi:hypothetical protein
MGRRARETKEAAMACTATPIDDDDTPITVSTQIPKDLKMAARIQAVREGRPFTKLVTDALRQYLETCSVR